MRACWSRIEKSGANGPEGVRPSRRREEGSSSRMGKMSGSEVKKRRSTKRRAVVTARNDCGRVESGLVVSARNPIL